MFSKGVGHLHTALKSLSVKHLIKINEFLGQEVSEPLVTSNFREIIFAYTTTVRKAPQVSNKQKDKLFCSIPFTHKIIDSLNLQSFLI